MRLSFRLVLGCSLAALAALAPATSHAQLDPAARRAAIEQMYPAMLQALTAKSYGQARNLCDQAIIWEPENPVHHYNLACIEAQTGSRRYPQAFAALDTAIALGFTDVQHLQSDPDLAPLRSDARFTQLLGKLAGASASAPGTKTAPPASDAATASKESQQTSAKTAASTEPPAHGAFNGDAPVGLYFMTRFWGATSTLEKVVWYFGPNGQVFQNLRHGFSPEDLASHSGAKGTAKVSEGILEITWATGKKTASKLARDSSGFSWDAGIFTPVQAFKTAAEAEGIYEGGESLGSASGRAAVAKKLELRDDGTFAWHGVSFVSTTSRASELSAGNSAGSKGRWALSGFSLTLTADDGTAFRGIVFPYDDPTTPIRPDRMFFGGLMYQRK